jgi:Fic family protein
MCNVNLTHEDIRWLQDHIKGGIRRADRDRRTRLINELEQAKTRVARRRTKTSTNPRKGMLVYGTGMYSVLEAFKSFPEGLTALEAAELSSQANKASARSNVSDLFDRKLIAVVARRNGSRVYTLTARGRTALRNAERKDTKQDA